MHATTAQSNNAEYCSVYMLGIDNPVLRYPQAGNIVSRKKRYSGREAQVREDAQGLP